MAIFIKIVSKIKKLLAILAGLAIVLGLFSPYAASFYVKKKYDNLIKNVQNLTPGIKITSHFQRKYLSCLLITKIQLANNAFFDYANNNQKNLNSLINYIPHNSITLQHDIKYSPHKKLIAMINTTILDGWPKFLQQNNNVKLVTTIDWSGHIKSIIKNINFNNIIDSSKDNYVDTKSMSIYVKNDLENLKLDIRVPKLVYAEYNNKTEIDDLHFQIKIHDFKEKDNRKINLLTEVNRLYVIENNKPILRLSNFNIQQNLAKSLINNVSFLRLNILEHKFGPLATKWKLNNINLSGLIKNFNHIRLPITNDQINSYKFIEISNNFLKLQPNLSVDLLLHIGNDKLKVLTDIIVDTKEMDWFTPQDILDSLTASIAAKIPKPVLMELVTFLVEERVKKENRLQVLYKPNNRNPPNMPKTFVSLDPKELQKQIDNMVVEKIAYLIKNNIIKEQEDGFSLDLSIAEGTFYSRMNPFKIFSF